MDQHSGHVLAIEVSKWRLTHRWSADSRGKEGENVPDGEEHETFDEHAETGQAICPASRLNSYSWHFYMNLTASMLRVVSRDVVDTCPSRAPILSAAPLDRLPSQKPTGAVSSSGSLRDIHHVRVYARGDLPNTRPRSCTRRTEVLGPRARQRWRESSVPEGSRGILPELSFGARLLLRTIAPRQARSRRGYRKQKA
jgi:hypothetical protein